MPTGSHFISLQTSSAAFLETLIVHWISTTDACSIPFYLEIHFYFFFFFNLPFAQFSPIKALVLAQISSGKFYLTLSLQPIT